VAKEMGVQITGSLGLLVAAKQKGYIEAVKPILEKVELWFQKTVIFWIIIFWKTARINCSSYQPEYW
jgi:predicted nucleic acid-binding protein